MRVLKESDNNELTFDYIKNSVEALEAAKKRCCKFSYCIYNRFDSFYRYLSKLGEFV